MGAQDSAINGAGEFPVTSWSLVARLQGSSDEQRHRALETLCRRYWPPVYCFVKRAWAKSPDDARDLTQAFFLQLLEGDALRRYDPGRGTFRTYLKVMIRGFASDQRDAAQTLKRGGQVKTFALDGVDGSLKEVLVDDTAASPDQAFDAQWRKQILEHAMDRTRRFFKDAGRDIQFAAFEAYDLAPGGKATYGDVAAKLGLKETIVRNYLYEVRERLRGEIRTELSQTVADRDQLEEEWKALFAP